MFSRLRETRNVTRVVALGLTSLTLGTALFAGPAMTASADPAVTIAEAKAQIQQLQVDSEAFEQDYVAVEQQVGAAKADLALKQQDAQLQTQKVDVLRKQVGQAALAQFQDRNVDTAAQLLLNSDTEGFLSQVSTIEKVGANQNTVLQDYQQQSASLADLQRSRQTDLSTLQKQEAELATLKAKSDKKLADAQAVLAKLTAEQKAALAKAEADQKKEAQALAESAMGKTPDTSTSSKKSKHTSSDDSSASSEPSGSSKGETALAFAKKQIGKPYVFGATGPGSYDCSGLTMSAWRAAGVSINRNSKAQLGNGQSVSRSDLQPGDLVFFYSPVSHVAIYAGGGMIVHAPHPGASVEYAKLSEMPFAGARRPG